MTTLYVANLTKQNHVFTYVMPETGVRRAQQIEMGTQQIIVAKDVEPEILSGIVAQHEPYGMVEVKSLDQTREFVGLCYSYDKPVPMEKIMLGHHHNEAVLMEKGVEYRKLAAIATDQQVRSNELPFSGIEIETTEITASRTERGMSERIEVVAEGATPRETTKPTTTVRGRRARK